MTEHDRLIIDAVHDADTGVWFKATGTLGKVWFSGLELMTSPTSVLKQIAVGTGHYIVNAALKRRLENEISDVPFRDGVVAAQSGWHKCAFICGDGTIFPADKGIDVVAFERLPKFQPEGSLADWQATVSRFVEGQILPLFVIALALTGALVRFLPSGTLNPIVELAGKKLSGKSTLGVLAASVWAGDREKTEGGGESWNMTANAFGLRRSDHRDMLLVLDEAEGSGANERDRQNLARSVIFTGSTTTEKLRMTDKSRTHAPLRLALLSTANTSMREILRNEPTARLEAAMSRVLPILVDREGKDGLPLFGKTPEGYNSPGEAASALRAAVDQAYGTAGPAFAKFIAEKAAVDERAFKEELRLKLNVTLKRLESRSVGADIRQCRTLAAIELGGDLAREAGVMPAEWGTASTAIDKVFSQIVGARVSSGANSDLHIKRFEEYVDRQLKMHKFHSSTVKFLPAPNLCEKWPGFIVSYEGGRRELLVAPKYFEKTFHGAREFLTAARLDGRLRIHSSEPDRLQIQAPKWMLSYGFKRVYAIELRPLRKPLEIESNGGYAE